ncbi:hypothetical protein [Allokutzneria multivorans]|uniref:hypothetical protein n=1 Tax=Allokutzneria multivorans TaxID=1142134 RepID=UPI0031ED8E2E
MSDAPVCGRCLRLASTVCPYLAGADRLRAVEVSQVDVLVDGYPWAQEAVMDWPQTWSVPEEIASTAAPLPEAARCPDHTR